MGLLMGMLRLELLEMIPYTCQAPMEKHGQAEQGEFKDFYMA